MLRYDRVEDHIRTGDIVFFIKSNNWLVKAVQQVFNTDQYHVGIVMKMTFNGEEKLFLVEASPRGRIITSLAVYKDKPLIILRNGFSPMDSPCVCKHHFNALLDGVGFVEYSFAGFFCLLIYEKFGIKLKKYKGETCAEMVAKTLELYETMVTPGKLYDYLINAGYKVVFRLNEKEASCTIE